MIMSSMSLISRLFGTDSEGINMPTFYADMPMHASFIRLLIAPPSPYIYCPVPSMDSIKGEFVDLTWTTMTILHLRLSNV